VSCAGNSWSLFGGSRFPLGVRPEAACTGCTCVFGRASSGKLGRREGHEFPAEDTRVRATGTTSFTATSIRS
jgi:hypothetical protein